MAKNWHNLYGTIVSCFTLCFCIAGVVLGLFLCLVQSPKMQAQKYAQAGKIYFAKATDQDLHDDSADYLMSLALRSYEQALAFDSYNPEFWLEFSKITQTSLGHHDYSIDDIQHIAQIFNPDILATERLSYRHLSTYSIQLTQSYLAKK